MSLLPACLALAAAAAAPVAPVAPALDVHVDELRGFRIDVPDGWRRSEQRVDERTFTLQLLPAGSVGERGVVVTVSDVVDGVDLDSIFAKARARAEDPDGDLSDFSERETELAGRPARGLEAVIAAPSGRYRLAQRYLLEDGRVYLLQGHAPVDDYAEIAGELDAVIATFDLVERSAEADEEARLLAIAARCGSEVSWADDWESAARRARDEDKLVLVSLFLLQGFAIHDTPRNSTFMDPDVIELVEERFVPLWYERGMDAAFVDSYGLGRSSFGQALLVVTPDGDVLQETSAASSAQVALPFLRAALDRNPAFVGAPLLDPAEATELERAAEHVARGEHAAARALLEDDESADAALLRVRMLRRERKGAEALAELAESGAEPAPALDVLEAGLRLRLGERERARELLEAVVDARPDTEPGREARVILGLLDLPGAKDAAKARWRALALEAPDSRWGWLAASALRSTALDLDVAPDLGWPDAGWLDEMLRRNEPSPVPLDHADEAADAAARWLLDHQTPSGAWGGPTDVRTAEGAGPNPFQDATAAIAGSALLRRAVGDGDDVLRAEAAARRALAFLIESVERRADEPSLVVFMDYTTWSNAMILRFVADALEHGLGDVEALAPVVELLVTDMAARKQDGGGWSYYVTGDVNGDGAPANSISFTTAAAVVALARAREVGFRVPDAVLEPALDALEAMRQEDGTFAYFLFHDTGAAVSGTEPEGAVGRGPVCELALLEAGRGAPERLGASLERFLDLRHLFAPEQGKVVMHAGPHGQGCHYLLFDYAHAALAHERLDAGARSRTKLLELVLACRQPDGSFLDTPILGRAYGTAMALTALDALAE